MQPRTRTVGHTPDGKPIFGHPDGTKYAAHAGTFTVKDGIYQFGIWLGDETVMPQWTLPDKSGMLTDAEIEENLEW